MNKSHQQVCEAQLTLHQKVFEVHVKNCSRASARGLAFSPPRRSGMEMTSSQLSSSSRSPSKSVLEHLLDVGILRVRAPGDGVVATVLVFEVLLVGEVQEPSLRWRDRLLGLHRLGLLALLLLDRLLGPRLLLGLQARLLLGTRLLYFVFLNVVSLLLHVFYRSR